MDTSELLQVGGLAVETLGFGILAWEVGQAKRFGKLLSNAQQSERGLLFEFLSQTAGTKRDIAKAFEGLALQFTNPVADPKIAASYSETAKTLRAYGSDLDRAYEKLDSGTAEQTANIAAFNARLDRAWIGGLGLTPVGMIAQLCGIAIGQPDIIGR